MAILDHRCFYTETFRAAFRAAARIAFDLSLHGAEHLPRQGPVLLAGNHPTYLDPFFLAALLPRRVHFMTWDGAWKVPWLGRFMERWGAFPVNQQAVNPATWQHALRVLRQGELLGLYPEGGRSWGLLMGECKSGVLRLALRTGAPIVPVTALGGWRVWHKSRRYPRRGRYQVILHPPLVLTDYERLNARRDGAPLLERLRAVVNAPLLAYYRARGIDPERFRPRGDPSQTPDLIR